MSHGAALTRIAARFKVALVDRRATLADGIVAHRQLLSTLGTDLGYQATVSDGSGVHRKLSVEPVVVRIAEVTKYGALI